VVEPDIFDFSITAVEAPHGDLQPPCVPVAGHWYWGRGCHLGRRRLVDRHHVHSLAILGHAVQGCLTDFLVTVGKYKPGVYNVDGIRGGS